MTTKKSTNKVMLEVAPNTPDNPDSNHQNQIVPSALITKKINDASPSAALNTKGTEKEVKDGTGLALAPSIPYASGNDHDIEHTSPSSPTAEQDEAKFAISDAYVVDPQEEEQPHYKIIDAQSVEVEKTFWQKFGIPLLIIGATVIAGIVAIVVIRNDNQANGVISSSSDTAGTPTPTTMIAATEMPSSSPTSFLQGAGGTYPPTSSRFDEIRREIEQQFVFDGLDDLKDGTVWQNPRSAQYRAALWMADMDTHTATANLIFPLNDTASVLEFRQRYALVTFFYATNGEDWQDQCNFLSPDLHVCDWICPWEEVGFVFAENMGVSCIPEVISGVAMNNVVGLEMISNGVSGTIPNEIAGLDILLYLQLQGNSIGGSIPFDAMSNNYLVRNSISEPLLFYVSMYGNQLTGSIPPSIGRFSAMISLFLADNLLSGSIPSTIGEMSALNSLLFGFNLFTGSVPSEILQLPEVLGIDLTENLLSGSLPEISSSQLTTTFLNFLNLSVNVISGRIPESLGRLSSLDFLDISINDLTGTIPKSFADLQVLSVFNAYENRLSGAILEDLSWVNSTALSSIFLSRNEFTGTISSTIIFLTTLRELFVGFSNLSGSIPSEIGLMKGIEDIAFSGNQLSGTIPTEIGSLSSNLGSLSLNGNKLTGSIPSEMGLLTNLDTLSLQANGLTGSLELLCQNNNLASSSAVGFRADCLQETLTCSCCRVCCRSDLAASGEEIICEGV